MKKINEQGHITLVRNDKFLKSHTRNVLEVKSNALLVSVVYNFVPHGRNGHIFNAGL